MKFNTKALALACAILWGVVMLGMGLSNLIWGGRSPIPPDNSVRLPRLPCHPHRCRGNCRNSLRSCGWAHRRCDLCLALQSLCQFCRLKVTTTGSPSRRQFERLAFAKERYRA